MELKDQVCALEYSKKVKELGVPQESYFYWRYNDGMDEWFIDEWNEFGPGKEFIRDLKATSAFTVAELGEMLKSDLQIFTNYVQEDDDWVAVYKQWGGKVLMSLSTKTEADARARLLIYLLEQKLITL